MADEETIRANFNRMYPGGTVYVGLPRAKPNGLRFGPYGIQDDFLPPCIVFRHVFNDAYVSDWQELEACHGTSLADLIRVLRREYDGTDPELRRGTTWSKLIIEDQFSNQYWGVEHLADLPTLADKPWTALLKEPTGNSG